MSDDQSPGDREAERWADVRQHMHQISVAYEAMVELLGTGTAHSLLSDFTEGRKPPAARRPKRGHDAAFSIALVAAYTDASRGQKMRAMRSVAAAHGRAHMLDELLDQHRRRTMLRRFRLGELPADVAPIAARLGLLK